MDKASRDAFDRRVLRFAKAKGTVCINMVARHFNVKWETAKRAIVRLTEREALFYHPDMGENPRFYSIWSEAKTHDTASDGQMSEKRETADEVHDNCARKFPFPGSIVRGAEGQVVEKVGFVAHPKARGSDLPRTFIRGHVHGQYLVDVKTVGGMPETFRVPDTELTGGWTRKRMNGNSCFYGHIKDPEDRNPYKFHCMSNKAGEIHYLSVYVHPRYIYYKDNAATASQEFRRQVDDVLAVLQRYGWAFGPALLRGTYSMGINDRNLASNVPVNHLEASTDAVLYDSSIGSGSGCTEAEILADREDAEADATLMVELPARFRALETSVAAIETLLERSLPAQETLTRMVGDIARATEFNTSILLGTAGPSPIETDSTREETKGDVMYGRERR